MLLENKELGTGSSVSTGSQELYRSCHTSPAPVHAPEMILSSNPPTTTQNTSTAVSHLSTNHGTLSPNASPSSMVLPGAAEDPPPTLPSSAWPSTSPCATHYYSQDASSSSSYFLDQAHAMALASPRPVVRTYPLPDQKRYLRFHIVLQAPTAVTQKTDDAAVTYLNRGQLYKIDLTDRFGSDMTIQSQFIIMFHEPSHRKLTMNYWKFWLSQQKACENARAVDVETSQCEGISNVTFPGFDSIAFEWNGSMGAKLCLRFHCLSTDFSRIKGVKGIPLRAFMSSQVTSSMHPSMMRQYAGTCSDTGDQSMHSYFEECFCKVRLFRDKGAERKNKDDAKQIKKQFAKMMHEGDSKEHPMWLMYNPSTPLSVFGEIPMHPALDMFEHASLIRDLNMPSPPLPTALPCHSLGMPPNANSHKSMYTLRNPMSASPTAVLPMSLPTAAANNNLMAQADALSIGNALAATPTTATPTTATTNNSGSTGSSPNGSISTSNTSNSSNRMMPVTLPLLQHYHPTSPHTYHSPPTHHIHLQQRPLSLSQQQHSPHLQHHHHHHHHHQQQQQPQQIYTNNHQYHRAPYTIKRPHSSTSSPSSDYVIPSQLYQQGHTSLPHAFSKEFK